MSILNWFRPLPGWLQAVLALFAAIVGTVIIVAGCLPSSAPSAPLQLKAIPNYGTDPKQIELTWEDASDDESGFKLYRKTGDGAFELIHTTAADATSHADPIADESEEYTYQVTSFNSNALGIDSESDPIETDPQNVWTIWPTPTSDDLLHTWNEMIGDNFAENGFHEGVDILRGNPEEILGGGVETEVVAVRGGVVTIINDELDSKGVVIEVRVGENLNAYLLNHLGDDDELLVDDNQIVSAGEVIGKIAENLFALDGLVDHTHYVIYDTYTWLSDYLYNPSTTQHPLHVFVEQHELDPGTNPPALTRHSGSPGDLRFLEHGDVLPETYIEDSLSEPAVIHGNVDIVAEISDWMGSSADLVLDQLPTKVAYWIEAPSVETSDCVTFHDVQSATRPYVLFDFRSQYFGDACEDEWIADQTYNYADEVRQLSGWQDFKWDNFKHLIVTNTKGTTGSVGDVNMNQHWNTNAKDDDGDEESPKANYAEVEDAVHAGEARFPDGVYTIHILASDLIHIDKEIVTREVRLENFPPIVCSTGLEESYPCGTTSIEGTVTFSEPLHMDIYPMSVIDLDNGAVVASAEWMDEGRRLSYEISNLVDGTTYTMSMMAIDITGRLGGKKIDGNRNGTSGDDYEESFSVESCD